MGRDEEEQGVGEERVAVKLLCRGGRREVVGVAGRRPGKKKKKNRLWDSYGQGGVEGDFKEGGVEVGVRGGATQSLWGSTEVGSERSEGVGVIGVSGVHRGRWGGASIREGRGGSPSLDPLYFQEKGTWGSPPASLRSRHPVCSRARQKGWGPISSDGKSGIKICPHGRAAGTQQGMGSGQYDASCSAGWGTMIYTGVG
eukprot:758485-Hanusia_phi.AAC.6